MFERLPQLRNTYDRESLHKVLLYMPKFGIKVYDELKYMLEYACEYRIGINVPDIYCLYDYKKFMADRVRYLNETKHIMCSPELQEKFDWIERFGRILSLLVLKLNQTEYYESNCLIFENV